MATPRQVLRTHIHREGGVALVAARIGVARSTLYRHLAGADLEPPHRAALRALLPRVPMRVWAELYAPGPVSSAAEVES